MPPPPFRVSPLTRLKISRSIFPISSIREAVVKIFAGKRSKKLKKLAKKTQDKVLQLSPIRQQIITVREKTKESEYLAGDKKSTEEILRGQGRIGLILPKNKKYFSFLKSPFAGIFQKKLVEKSPVKKKDILMSFFFKWENLKNFKLHKKKGQICPSKFLFFFQKWYKKNESEYQELFKEEFGGVAEQTTNLIKNLARTIINKLEK